MGMFLFIVLALIVLLVITGGGPSEAIGSWSHLFADMKHDPEAFYSEVEKILEERQIPDVKTARKNFKEGGLLSHQRLYLEVSRGDYIYHICAAPWGTGFFFSWWLRERLSELDAFLIKIPYIGSRIVKARALKSYYRLDTDAMFKASVQQSVMAAIDRLTEAKGIRGLTELERKPDLRSIIK